MEHNWVERLKNVDKHGKRVLKQTVMNQYTTNHDQGGGRLIPIKDEEIIGDAM
jgi:hypothetical protein